MHTYRIVTLGCKVSRADAANIDRALRRSGLREADNGSPASVCVVAGCAVTGIAEGKSRRTLARIRRENPGAVVIAAGCIASRMGELTPEEPSTPASPQVSQADIVLPPGKTEEVVSALTRLEGFEGLAVVKNVDERELAAFPGRTRALVKVQDGCGGSCSYCIVPRLRGAPSSRPMQSVLDEIRALTEAGHAEVVLAGVRLGLYRAADTQESAGLTNLVSAILEIDLPELVRLRLSSIEPIDFDMALADLAATRSSLCPHFHLPIQSADDEVLRMMNRPYDVARYSTILRGIRERIPDVALSTDLIAGFPGETEDAHERTLEFVRGARFARLHAFPFSPRPGTPAAEMPGAVTVETARLRARELIEAGEAASRDYRSQFIGHEQRVIAEPGPDESTLAGYTDRYARMTFAAPAGLVGGAVRVRAVTDAPNGFEGVLCK